ncbi:DeoR/GlpR family DNA-binding transcription regulator [uncultured Varibaculum sp.]|uniref:DeoR/GlpR family DNA-binding transcription regulator n=1 Tax=uncultured Varibaculum sp. TaxID=413896 RepID=UPI00258AC0A7|nr:DeoR/GlpR family DNA-binding transcription regulator [uncultured Varibaculum sp.]
MDSKNVDRNTTTSPSTERQEEIVDRIMQDGTVKAAELAAEFGVSAMTIRRDLQALDNKGYLKRIHGGAVTRPEPIVRSYVQSAEKERIARAVQTLVPDNAVIGIDVGTTCSAVGRVLAARDDLVVVTNSIFSALPFRGSNNRLILLGGEMTDEGSLINNEGLEQASTFNLDVMILGCGGISEKRGITYSNLEETYLRRTLIKNADRVILAADSTKYGKIKPYHLCRLGRLDILVSDALPSEQIGNALEDSRVKIKLA